MHRNFLYAAYGWLALIGVAHFAIDVVSQYMRGIRSPSHETTLYYGLNTTFAFGQLLFGLLGLWLALKAPLILDDWRVVGLSLAAAAGWLAIGFLFLEYWEPRFAVAVFGVLVLCASATSQTPLA